MIYNLPKQFQTTTPVNKAIKKVMLIGTKNKRNNRKQKLKINSNMITNKMKQVRRT